MVKSERIDGMNQDQPNAVCPALFAELIEPGKLHGRPERTFRTMHTRRNHECAVAGTIEGGDVDG